MPGLWVFLVGLAIAAGAAGVYVTTEGNQMAAMVGASIGGVVALIGVVQMVAWSLGGSDKPAAPSAPKRSAQELELMIQSMLFVAWADKAMHGLELQHVCNVMKNSFGINVTLPVVQAVSKKFTAKQAEGFPAVVEYQRSKISPATRDKIITMAIGVAGADRKMRASERDAIYKLSGSLQPPSMNRARIDQELAHFTIITDAPAAKPEDKPAEKPAETPAAKPAPMNEVDLLVQSMLFVARADGSVHGLEVDHICRVLKNSFDVPVTMALVQQVSTDFTPKQTAEFPAVLEAQRDNIPPATRDRIIEVVIGVASADRKLLFAEGEAINVLVDKLQAPTFNRARVASELDRLLR